MAPTNFLKSFLFSIVRWFDTHAGTQEKRTHLGPNRVDWMRCMPFFILHVMCLAAFIPGVGWSWIALAVAAGLYVVRMFAITGFYHRYFSHRTYKVSRAMQFLMALAGAACVQRGALWWAAHHRHHHKHSDDVEDAHSPRHHGFWWSHMGWITAKKNFATDLDAIPDLAKFPELVFLDRFDVLVPILLAVALFFVGVILNAVWPGLGTNGMQMLTWGFFISTVCLFHGTCTINSLSHVFGTRRFETTDTSRNNLLLALVTLGEGWHNNHHHYQATARQGFYWWEIDITWYVLKALSWVRLVRDLKPVPAAVLTQTRKP